MRRFSPSSAGSFDSLRSAQDDTAFMNGSTTTAIPRRSFGETMSAAFLECEAITSFSKRNNRSLDDGAVRNQEGVTGKRAGALDLLTNELLQLRIEKSIATWRRRT